MDGSAALTRLSGEVGTISSVINRKYRKKCFVLFIRIPLDMTIIPARKYFYKLNVLYFDIVNFVFVKNVKNILFCVLMM